MMFKKKSGIKRDNRTRDIDKEYASSSNRKHDEEEDSSSLMVTKRRKFIGNDLLQSTTGSGRRGTDVVENKNSDDIDEMYIGSRDDATRSSAWYDDGGEGSGTKIIVPDLDADEKDDMYKGMASYKKFSDAKANSVKGPIRANNNVRTVTMVDYQPSVCKPYKETGMCGFGDSCIYLHDRSDYLAGWKLDKLPNSISRKNRNFLDDDQDMKEDKEELPFACLICRKHFTDPVVTNCGHYFCSKCAIKRYSEKSSKCFACGKQTQGIFNSAKKILDRMERVRLALDEEEEDEEGEDGTNYSGQADDNLLEGVQVG